MSTEQAEPPFAIVMNAGSGASDKDSTRAQIAAVLDDAGRTHRFFLVDDPSRMDAVAREAVAWVRDNDGAVVAAGGDGTINCVASAAWEADVPMGVLPQGTFNFFGRTHNIPADARAATQALLAAHTHDAQIGLVNDRVFLVNASLGLYPEVLQDRELWKQRFGRHRIVALWSGLVTMLKRRRSLHVDISDGERSRTLKTPTLVVGNNALQLELIGIPEASQVHRNEGTLAGIMLRPIGRRTMLGLILRGALGKLGDAENVVTFAFRNITVTPKRSNKPIKVAIDGEIVWLAPPLTFRCAPRPLRLLAESTRLPGEDPG
ncbi:diacylglycerol kinase family enzyme [Luteibacter sp. Sphag1AF]|uniref:diacylglycerol/lipid kinase family protein n=1 Tax=Luteibacter sp. Sphag1AF TaxID=2587031 RepID=UPI00160B4E80|nr:diacylglycerol kinase family protein [Luteibacter sp. Sphag1AF]MBB3227397.1 diacylglycerol kinase family enzyme [Luteibacter sp. Sphag1AF]